MTHRITKSKLPRTVKHSLTASPIIGAPTAVTAFVGAAKRGAVNKAVFISSFAEFEQRFGGLIAGVELGYAVQQFFLNGGADAFVIRIARNASVAATMKGILALDKVGFNLLVLPGVAQADILQRAASYCEKRRALFLLDSPKQATTSSDMEQIAHDGSLPKSSHAALFFPWLQTSDPLSGGFRLSPPASAVAGLFARWDKTRGVWKSATGAEATLVNADDVAIHPNESQMSSLNAAGVNCLRRLPTGATVVWGERTLSDASEWRYISVRRLALFLETSVARNLQWASFEPNAEPLWQQVRLTVETFLQSLFVQGALIGATPREAYFVKCGPDTMTADEIGQGLLNVEIGFAPQRPAEFVVIKLQSLARHP
jgi:Bacteriophage tail sheath protein